MPCSRFMPSGETHTNALINIPLPSLSTRERQGEHRAPAHVLLPRYGIRIRTKLNSPDPPSAISSCVERLLCILTPTRDPTREGRDTC